MSCCSRVKTQDVAACVRELAAFDPPTVCLTNGVEAERIAARHLSQVHGACIYMPATHLEPGCVQAWSWPLAGAIDVGRYPHGDGDLVLAADGLASVSQPDIMRWKRGKLLTNLANAAEALTGPAARQSTIAEQARAEAIACFEAAGLVAHDRGRGRVSPHRHPVAADRRRAPLGRVDLAEPGTRPCARGRLPQRRDRAARPPVGHRDANQHRLQRLANAAARAGARPGSMSLAELEAALRS